LGREQPRFVVVVEDLERCQLPKALDVCEVVAQLLDHPGVITVLVGDLRVIAASAQVKYKDAAERVRPGPRLRRRRTGPVLPAEGGAVRAELPSIPEWRLRELARSAPPTASIHGGHASRQTPMPSLLRRSSQSLRTLATIGLPAVTILIAALIIALHLPWWEWMIVGASCSAFLGALVALDVRRRRVTALGVEVGRLDSVISNVALRFGGHPRQQRGRVGSTSPAVGGDPAGVHLPAVPAAPRGPGLAGGSAPSAAAPGHGRRGDQDPGRSGDPGPATAAAADGQAAPQPAVLPARGGVEPEPDRR
jgi:KAP family P-loop domain